MNIKKAISLIAFGFMFTLVNLNLTLNGTTVNVTPNFVGWILMYLAYDKLGDYMKGKSYMKILSLVLIVLTGALWLGDIVKPDLDTSIIKTIANIASAVYMFVLCIVLENVARDFGSTRESTIRTLKYLNIGVEIMFVVIQVLYVLGFDNIGFIAIMVSTFGLIGIVAAVVTMFVLFGLNKEISSKLE